MGRSAVHVRAYVNCSITSYTTLNRPPENNGVLHSGHNYPRGGSVKNFGLCLIVAGAIWGVIAFNMTTSVETESRTIGSGLYSLNIPSQTVHNLDLADQRRNHLIGAGITLLAGVLLFGFGSMKPAEETLQTQKPTATEVQSTERKCPFCAETIKQEAVVCRFCNRDVPAQIEPIIEISAAEKYLNSIKDEDKATYEKYNQQTEKERKSACFACHGEDSACGMCDFRESNLKKYLEAKQAAEAAA